MQDYSNYPLLGNLASDEMQELMPEMQEVHYTAGQQIMRQGETSQRVYMIVSGQVRIYIEQGTKVELAELSKGHFFGEMSCLTGDAVSAHVEAIGDVHAVTLSRAGMLLLMDKSADFRNRMIETMIQRIQNSNSRVLEEHTKSLILMKQREIEESKRIGELIGQSAAMQTMLRRIELLSKEEGHIIIVGEPGTGKMSVASKLHYLTTGGQYPLIRLNPSDMELADWETKVHAAKGGTVIMEKAEECSTDQLHRLLDTASRTRVVMTSQRPLELSVGTTLHVPPLRERVEDIPLLAQYFAAKERGGDAEEAISQDALRMLALYPYLTENVEELHSIIKEACVLSEGRMIYGHHLRFGRRRKENERPKIGLALGSGAARGLAHLGVLRVLEQEGIPIDMIAGTSVGSIIGGVYAAGMPIKDIVEVVESISWGKIIRPTLPIRSLVHNAPLIGFIEKYVGKRQIEDLPIPFGAVASDVSTGEAHIMRTGSLAHAMCASTAVPAIMRPVNYEGKWLADGATVHPVPAALVRSMGADIVIAVNVCTESFTRGSARHLIDSLMNTIDIMSAKLVREELQLADIVLRPDLGFGQISFKDASNYVMAGEAVTQEAITLIRQKIESVR